MVEKASIISRPTIRAQSLPIRLRLTAWYTVALAAVLVLFVLATAAVSYWQLYGQLTRFAIQDVETIEGLLYFTPDGALRLNEDYHNHAASRMILERLLEVISPDGTILFRNWRLGSDRLGGAPLPAEGINGYSPRIVHLADGSRVLTVSRRHTLRGTPLILRIGYREDAIFSRIGEFLTAALTTLPILLAIAALFGYHLVRGFLAPLKEMAVRAQQITAEHLDRRLPIANSRDEIGNLGSVINDLLDRLDRSFAHLRRFTSDASHELRTPLAAIRSVGEVGLQGEQTAAGYRDTIGSMLEEVTRLTALVESLLTISRADAGQIELNHSVFSAYELADEVISLIGVLAEERGQEIVLSGDKGVAVEGDRVLARQALLNVLHNATKYSPAHGRIEVSVNSEGPGLVAISVSDAGPGIAPEHRDRIFDRFYRAEEARTRDTGGTGLGLAIAKWSVEAQGGSIQVKDSERGATFLIELRSA